MSAMSAEAQKNVRRIAASAHLQIGSQQKKINGWWHSHQFAEAGKAYYDHSSEVSMEVIMDHLPNFLDFLESWREDIIIDNPSSVERGRRFAQKILKDWLNSSDEGLEYFYCDGAGDGGIDLAILNTGSDDSSDGTPNSHTWYLIQSKFGKAFQGSSTLFEESQKLIETLEGKRHHLNSMTDDLVERISNFRKAASENDKIILCFATENPLNDQEKSDLNEIRYMGRHRLGEIFDVESISVENIYKRIEEDSVKPEISVVMRTNVVPSGDNLLVGSTKLIDLYKFLSSYRKETNDLDKIYDKNVRRYLGGRRRVNLGMENTLKSNPENFGLFNNGITIVVSDWKLSDDQLTLDDPHIVNGCQTSRTIWTLFDKRLACGGNGRNPELEHWERRVSEAAVVTKIVRVGSSGEGLLKEITRYTNSQNAVQEKDFLALSKDFSDWQREMSDRYDIYLEIQRGGWDSQKAFQKRNINTKRYDRHVNSADLIKVYGAGWLEAAGPAFAKNPPFLPGGAIFEKMMAKPTENEEPFGVDDLYAAYLLQLAGDEQKFGRQGNLARRQTRFLFYFIVVRLLKYCMIRSGISVNDREVSQSIIKVLKNPDAYELLITTASSVIDDYMSRDFEDNVFKEPLMIEKFNSDLNAFLKIDGLGKQGQSPNLYDRIHMAEALLNHRIGGTKPIELIKSVINHDLNN